MSEAKFKLHVVLRTCDTTEVHPDPKAKRLGGVDKTELIQRCVRSLFTSIEAAKGVCTAKVSILDDGSTPALRDHLSKLPASFTSITGSGNGDSMHSAYSKALVTDADLIYFVEDDYLHHPEAIKEMVLTYILFRNKLGGAEVAIHPTDDPAWYMGDIDPCRVVFDGKRHWRTGWKTTFTVAMTRTALVHHWETLMAFCKYGEPGVSEDTTINQIWRKGEVVLFSPIPALAVHMQYLEPPVVDWKAWFEANKENVQ